jgi:hypothetical protein
MIRIEISKELFDLMNKPPEKKQDVTHALIQIRKLLECDGQQKENWTLHFFCDWTLHSELSHVGARKIVSLLDERLRYFRPPDSDSDPCNIIHRIVSLTLFREELSGFLKRNDLPTVWTEDQFTWQSVVRFYGQQVRDTPLVMMRADCAFKYIQRVVVSACEPSKEITDANPREEFYGLKWDFTLSDGCSFSIPYTSNIALPPEGWITQGFGIRLLFICSCCDRSFVRARSWNDRRCAHRWRLHISASLYDGLVTLIKSLLTRIVGRFAILICFHGYSSAARTKIIFSGWYSKNSSSSTFSIRIIPPTVSAAKPAIPPSGVMLHSCSK